MATLIESEIIHRDVQPLGRAVRRKLAAARSRLRWHLVCEGLAATVLVLVALIVLSYATDRWLRLSTSTRLALLPAGAAAVLATVYLKLWRPLRLRLDDLDLAVILDRRLPGFGERVADVLQLPSLLERDPAASPAMIRAAVERQARALSGIDLGERFDRSRARRLAAAIVVPLLLLAGLVFAWPDSAALWAKRCLLGSRERWPQRTYLSIVGLADGDHLSVARGESIMVEVDAQPQFAPEGGCFRLSGRGESLSVAGAEPPSGQVPDEIRIRYRQAGVVRQGMLTQYTGSRFRYELPPIQEPVPFSLLGGDDWLGPIMVVPLDRPGIEDLKIVSRTPGRDETETHAFGGQESQLLFLAGTALELSLTADKPLASAELVPSAGTAPRLERIDPRRFVARWSMGESQTLAIKLVDAEAGLESKSYFISLNLLHDRVPRVNVRSSGVGRRITPQATIPTALRAADDFGLASARIDVEQTEHRDDKPAVTLHARPIELPAAPSGGPALAEFDSEQAVNIAEYAIAPGSVVKLRGAATDNRAEGSQEGLSRWLSFQVVTPEELFYEILMVQRAQREKFRGALETEKTQLPAFETVVDAEQLSAIVRKHQVAARQVWQVANRLEATLQEMTLNELGSSQARDLLATGIVAPLRELHSQPLAQLKTLLDRMTADPKQISETSPAALAAQQEIVEQMTKILDRMSQWESFVDVLNQVRQIMQLQNQVLDSTQKTKEERTKDVFDE